MKRMVLLAWALVVLSPTLAPAEDKLPDKVQVFVKSGLLQNTLASELRAGKKVTAVEIQEKKATKIELSDVLKGEGEMPKAGTYSEQKIAVFKGKKYKTYDVYLSAPLPKGTRLKNFTFKGTFTGKWGKNTHKYTFFEATPTKP